MTKTLTELAIQAYIKRDEFKLLNTCHKELFKRRLSNYYINYALDDYNKNKKWTTNVNSVKYSLVKTLELMISDFKETLK